MSIRGLVIFDVFNTLVTARRGSKRTFLAGLAATGLTATDSVLAELQAASEGFDHSAWSGSRGTYVSWAKATLAAVSRSGLSSDDDRAAHVVPALEQLHQAPMVAMPGAQSCLRRLRAAGFTIAVCSNWGWDLEADLERTGLTVYVDCLVTSAQVGCRKPNPRIYQSTLDRAGFGVEDAVFVGDSLRTDVLGPQSAGIRSVLLSRVASETFHGEQAPSLAAVSHLLVHRTADSVHQGSHTGLGKLSGPVGRLVRRHRSDLVAAAAAHGVSNLRVFGSVACGQDRPDSDVDLLADLPPGMGVLGLERVQADLEAILGTRVDLVPAQDLMPDIRSRAERDLVAL